MGHIIDCWEATVLPWTLDLCLLKKLRCIIVLEARGFWSFKHFQDETKTKDACARGDGVGFDAC